MQIYHLIFVIKWTAKVQTSDLEGM